MTDLDSVQRQRRGRQNAGIDGAAHPYGQADQPAELESADLEQGADGDDRQAEQQERRQEGSKDDEN